MTPNVLTAACYRCVVYKADSVREKEQTALKKSRKVQTVLKKFSKVLWEKRNYQLKMYVVLKLSKKEKTGIFTVWNFQAADNLIVDLKLKNLSKSHLYSMLISHFIGGTYVTVGMYLCSRVG